MALARIHLSTAEACAIGGDAKATGAELGAAIQLDRLLLDDQEELGNRLIFWSHLYAAASTLGNPYRRFADDVFVALAGVMPSVAHLKRRVLSDSVMGTVFSAHAAGDLKKIRRLLPTGLYANPKWLLNRGVWSIAGDAFLGHRVTNPLRWAYRHIPVAPYK